MTYAYFYLVGQNITYFAVSWRVSLLLNVLVAVVAGFARGFSDGSVVAVFIGWLSIVWTVEHKLNVPTTTYNCFTHATAHFSGITLAMEIVLFTLLSILLIVDDGSLTIWAGVIFGHTVYIIIVYSINKASKRVAGGFEGLRYYVVYAMLLFSTDLYYVALSAIVHDRRQNLVGTCIIAAITAVVFYLTERQHLDRLLIVHDDDDDINDDNDDDNDDGRATDI